MGPAAVPWTQKLAPAEKLTARPPPLVTQTCPWTGVGARMTTLAPATTPSPTTSHLADYALRSGGGSADDHMVWDSERWQRPLFANEDAPRGPVGREW